VIEPTNWWKTNIVLFIPKHTPKCHDITRLIFEGRHLDLSLRKAQIQKSAHLRKSVRFHVPGRLTTEMPFSTDDHEPPNWITAKLANLVWRMTPDCREVTRLTSEGRDRPLPLGTRLRLGLHRCFCKWCARYAKQLDLLHEANLLFAEHVDQIGGPTLDSDAKARIKLALQTAANGES
jgi:hypothetical protein